MSSELVTQQGISAPMATPAVAAVEPTDAETKQWNAICQKAEKLAAATLTPAHLKVLPSSYGPLVDPAVAAKKAWMQTVSNCILVANQAARWKADVFAVAAETYVVQNKLGYQGKLIAAIVNARAGLSAPLDALHSTGSGDDFAAVIFGKRDGEIPDEAFELLEAYADNNDMKAARALKKLGVLAVRISVGQAKTTNKMWREDPEQKLFYTGATKWARRFAPELMLGILSEDDLQKIKDQETGYDRVATESRIGAVIPASLDASGYLPGVTAQVPPSPPATDVGGEEEGGPESTGAPAPNSPNDGPTLDAKAVVDDPATDAEVTKQVAEWLDHIASLTSKSELRELFGRIPKDWPDESKKGVCDAIDARIEAIHKSRGSRSNAAKDGLFETSGV